MKGDITATHERHAVQPSARRVAVAQYVLNTDEHPSADRVLARVGARFPHISRASVYNTPHLFVEKGLLRELYLAEGKVIFDSNPGKHQHFICATRPTQFWRS